MQTGEMSGEVDKRTTWTHGKCFFLLPFFCNFPCLLCGMECLRRGRRLLPGCAWISGWFLPVWPAAGRLPRSSCPAPGILRPAPDLHRNTATCQEARWEKRADPQKRKLILKPMLRWVHCVIYSVKGCLPQSSTFLWGYQAGDICRLWCNKGHLKMTLKVKKNVALKSNGWACLNMVKNCLQKSRSCYCIVVHSGHESSPGWPDPCLTSFNIEKPVSTTMTSFWYLC